MKLALLSDGFSLSLNGKEMLRHTKTHPMVSIGKGITDVKSTSGHFSVKEHSVEMVSLSDATIVESNKEMVTVDFNRDACRVVITLSTNGEYLTIKPAVKDSSFNRLKINVCADEDERIYGSGELFDRQNIRGTRRPLWISEPGVGRRRDLFTLLVASKTKHV
ncbi:MAG: hypothetical protein PF450_15175, partial [Bacteroidales bacterium]|nr:hypothetical protein [Bacteroidales bacterium]